MGKVCFLLTFIIILVVSVLAQDHLKAGCPSDVNYLGAMPVKENNLSAQSSLDFGRLSENRSLGNFSTGDRKIDRFIEESSARHSIDPLLIYAQMNQESRFKQKAVSPKGASGLMQLMPDTAARFGVKNMYDSQQNIEAGVKYMRWLLKRFDGDLRLALAGYNAGEGAVEKYDNRIPPYRETQVYVRKITANYAKISQQNLESKVTNSALERQIVKTFEEIS